MDITTNKLEYNQVRNYLFGVWYIWVDDKLRSLSGFSNSSCPKDDTHTQKMKEEEATVSKRGL